MQAGIEAGCIWYLLSSDSPSHTFIRAARCYNITPIWPGSNRRPYRPAWEPQTVQRFKFWASRRGASPRAPWPVSRNPRPLRRGRVCGAAFENSANPGGKILCSLPVGWSSSAGRAGRPQLGRTSPSARTAATGPTTPATHDLFYCETRDLCSQRLPPRPPRHILAKPVVNSEWPGSGRAVAIGAGRK